MRSAVRAAGRPLRVAGAAALASALFWTPATAGSAERPESASSVAFTGGCGLLSTGLGGSSNPDLPEVSVPAGAEFSFTNRLGQLATLQLDGEPAAEVAPGDTATVVFHDGPVTAAMQINCLLGKPAGEVLVEVTEPRAATPPPPPPVSAPAPAPPPPPPPPPPPASSDSASATSGQVHGGVPAPGAPDRSGATGTRPTDGDAATGSAPSSWAGDAYGPALPAPPPPRDLPYPQPETASPDEPPRSAPGDEFGLQWGDSADGGGAPPAGGDRAEVAGVAAEQVSGTGGSASTDGLVGLLALIATVCVAGVSAGAVRAVLAHRANRLEPVT